MELTSSHIYIKNISTSGTIHTEHLLNTGRRPQPSKRARTLSHNQVGQKKKRKELGWDLCTREGAVKEEMLPHSGKSPHQRGDQPGWRGSFGASDEITATSLRKAKQ